MSGIKQVGRIAALSAVALMIPTKNAVSQFGFVGIATEYTQLANNAQLANSYVRLGEQLRQQALMYADMVRNSKVLPSQLFGPIQEDINQLARIVQTGRALAYSMGNFDSEFRSRFRGYAYNSNNWFKDYKIWAETSLDTTLGTLKAAGLQGQELQSEQAILANLRRMAASSDGHLLTLQVIGDIAEQQTQQLMKLRQLMLADLSSKQAYQAVQMQKDATTQSSVEQFFKYTGRVPDGKTYQGGWK